MPERPSVELLTLLRSLSDRRRELRAEKRRQLELRRACRRSGDRNAAQFADDAFHVVRLAIQEVKSERERVLVEYRAALTSEREAQRVAREQKLLAECERHDREVGIENRAGASPLSLARERAQQLKQ